ncbi:RNA-binding protein 44 isoform X2 [Crotalus tigris]|uniref:RNA-binding protein 44 isoform X2 n=1 Tax=Crotalus tigris TaxID=88082 RepID=UPI00192F92BF|nr:RNA-binding protein 44 isoform X2 [Crotalus tigris]
MECRKCRVEKDADTSPILKVSQEATCFQKYEVDNTSSNLQMGAEYSISSQSCYLSASLLNLSKENLISSGKEECMYIQKQQQNTSNAVETTNERNINTDFCYFKNKSANKCNYFDDNPQSEYHSVEQDYVDSVCSYRQKTDNSEIFQVKKMINEKNVTDHQQPFSTSGCEQHYNGNEISIFPQMFQDVNYTENQHITLGEKRNESLSMFYSIVEDSTHIKVNKKKNNSKLFLANKAEIEEKIKVKFLSDTTLKSVTATTKEILKTNDYLNKTGNPNIYQETTLLPFSQVSHNAEDSNICAHKPSVIVNSDIKNSIYSSCEHHGNYIDNFSSTELKCITNTYHESCNNLKSAINQAIDATADFRANFTTSRAINVKSSMASKAQNTVITMMSKCRPREWLAPEIMPVMADYRSVACNTDWSCISGNVEMIDSQVAISDTLEDCITNGATKHGWKSKSEDPLEWSNITSKDLNEIPYSSPLGTSKSVSEMLLSQDNEVPFLHLITSQKNENSDSHQCLSKMEERENSLEEKNSRVQSFIQCSGQEQQRSSEKGSLNTQEISEEWFDATENPTTLESSVLCADPLESSPTETQTIDGRKHFLKNNYFVHVDGLSPSVSEVDLWLHFQKYNISEVLVCEYSENYRYASLNFKTACDAKLAVKEMNGREIKGKAMKVQLKRTIKEKGIQDNQNCMKQKWENPRPLSKHRNKYQKNSDLILEVPAVISATFILPPNDPFSLKTSDVSKDDLKSPLPALPLANVFRPASSEVLLCVSGSSKVSNSDTLFSKSLPKESSFEVDQEDTADSLLPFSSVQYTPNPSSTFLPPNTLNLRSFRKVVKKLEELYPEITRDNILDALVEIKENKGQLSGLPLSTIVQMTSSLLNKKFASKSEKK